MHPSRKFVPLQKMYAYIMYAYIPPQEISTRNLYPSRKFVYLQEFYTPKISAPAGNLYTGSQNIVEFDNNIAP